MREEAKRSFNLDAGPLIRLKLLVIGEDDHVLLINMHHIVSDGWSAGILADELSKLYEAFIENRESPLEELPLQYGDFAVWQREWLKGEELERQMKYWREQLAEMQPLELPTDYQRPAVMSHRGGRVSFSLSADLTQRLKALSRQEGVTLFMTLTAAFQLLLGRYAGQEDVAIGTPIANRNRKETEGLIGFFVNTLIVRTSLAGDPSFRELLARVRETCLGAYAHQDLPFEKLVEELAPERDLSRSPLFQVMLAFQSGTSDLRLKALRLNPFTSNAVSAVKSDISIDLRESNSNIHGNMRYAMDLFECEAIRQV